MSYCMDYCPSCGGFHEKDDNEIYVEWNGKRYTTPFLCMCCGKEICARQFAYGRMCGICDSGSCLKYPEHYHPPFENQ